MINGIEIGISFFYFFILIVIGVLIKPMMCNAHTEKYFLPALALKLIGGLSVGGIYYLYYGGGDTVNYFEYGASPIFDAFMDSPIKGLALIFGKNEITPENVKYASRIFCFTDSPSYFCVRFAGFFNLFSFNTYGGTVLLFAFYSFLCLWPLYNFLARIYSNLSREFAIGFFFLPSVYFWGSGILKDTITFAFLALLILAALKIYYEKRALIRNIIIIIISGYIVASIKIYILIALIPALIFLFLYSPLKNIKNGFIRTALTPFIFATIILVGFLGIKKVGESNKRYNLETMAHTAQETAKWIHYVSKKQGGSAYSLGDYDFSASGVLKKTIPAIWVSLFRPHPWEVRNPVMLLSAIEAAFFLYLFIVVFIKNIRYVSGALNTDIFISFCLIFSFIFSWAVGLTTYNFGSLVRYKIPMMPFFIIAMYLLKDKIETLKQD